ncbi:MAG: hypothetical protein ACR2FS_05000 [Phormidesmis sp.]
MTATTQITTTSTATASQPNHTESALTTFSAHPSTRLTWQAMTATADGFRAVWAMEKESKFGQSVALFLKDIFIACLLPLLSLLWLALTTAYRFARHPETRAAVVSRYQSAKDWAAPKFGYEQPSD